MNAIGRLRLLVARWHLWWIFTHEHAAESASDEAFMWLIPDEDFEYDDPIRASGEAARLGRIVRAETAKADRHRDKAHVLFDKLLPEL